MKRRIEKSLGVREDNNEEKKYQENKMTKISVMQKREARMKSKKTGRV